MLLELQQRTPKACRIVREGCLRYSVFERADGARVGRTEVDDRCVFRVACSGRPRVGIDSVVGNSFPSSSPRCADGHLAVELTPTRAGQLKERGV